MSVKARGITFQTDFMMGGRRIRQTFPTHESAEQFEKDSQAKHQLGILTTPLLSMVGTRPNTLGELFETVYEMEWSKKKSAETARINYHKITGILGVDLPLSQVNSETIDALVKALGKASNKGSTINRKLACIGKALRFAHRRGWIPLLPVLPRMRETRGRVRFVSHAEEQDMLKYFEWAQATDMSDLATLLVDTGMRLGEALSLQSKDADMKQKLIRIWENKADHPRSIPMTNRVAVILQRRMTLGESVFNLTKNQVEHRWHKMRDQLGLSHDTQFVPHCLRHTCASRLVQNGIDLYVVKEFLGHKSIVVTQRYAHLAPKQLFNAARALEHFQTTGENVQLKTVA